VPQPTRPLNPGVSPPGPAAPSPALRRACAYRLPKWPCDILLCAQSLKIRQRVGCGNLLTLNLGEMSIAVEREGFTGTAKRLREDTMRLIRRASQAGRCAPRERGRV
jgi:hypothetical protein